MTVLLAYEGVLQSHKHQPILDGFLLAHSLAAGHRLVVLTSGSKERVEHQLRTERLMDQVAEIVDETAGLKPLPLWQRQIEKVRSEYAVSLVVSADPEVIQWVVEQGVIGLFFAHPGFSRPAQRPIQGTRNWDALVAEVEARI